MLQRKLGLFGLAVVLTASTASAADIEKYLPADANMVMQINIRQAIDSPLIKKFFLKQAEDVLKNNQQAQEMLKALDLDPLKDLESFTIGGTFENPRDNQNMVIVVRGKFNVEKITAAARTFAREQGAIKISTISGKTVIEGGQGRQSFYGTFIDGNTAVMSPSKELLTNAIDGKSGKPSRELAGLLSTVNNKQTMWAAFVLSDAIRKQLGKTEGAGIAAKIRNVTGGINITKDVGVALRIETTDADTAKELATTINQLKGLLKFLGQSEARLEPLTAEIIKTLQVKEGDSNVDLSFKLSEGTVEKLIKNFDLPPIP